MKDLIERQEAIDAVAKILSDREGGNATWWKPVAESVINDLPSAQPEPLTYKEQIIFLAAMGREENICKQVDDEHRDYEDSLVRICHEIARKVKGALWPI